MAKLEHQVLLITRLKEFTGRVPAAYANQKEFFINCLHSMSEHLVDLKRETLREACEDFSRKLDSGTVTDNTSAEFRGTLEKLVPAGDFTIACASMIAGKELLRKRLAALTPLSLVEEEKKAAGRDAEADRQIRETYARLNFAPLVAELAAGPDARAVDGVLEQARAEVAEYCCLYRIPLDEAGTLTPYSLACIDAVLAACHRILANLRKTPGGKTVLIVDDDEAILDLLTFLVRREGFKTEGAADGEQALRKARALCPDLLLLDLMLPKCSGFEILRELQDDGTAGIPIVIVTGRNADPSTAEMIKREPNVRGFIQKPIKPNILADLLHAILKVPAKTPR